MRLLTSFVATIVICSTALGSDLQLASLFTDGMVLQQGAPVRIWGTAAPLEKVHIEFAGQSHETNAAKDGSWMIVLKPLPIHRAPLQLTVDSTEKKLVRKNILVGEVWLAGGQSNMKTGMQAYKQVTQSDMDASADSELRFITIPKVGPRLEEEGVWFEASPESVRTFSATSYYFAKALREQLDVPVGVIVCASGGSPAEAWMSRGTLQSHPELNRIVKAFDGHCERAFQDRADYIRQLNAYTEASKEYRKRKKAALSEGSEPPPKPKEVIGWDYPKRPGGLYEEMLKKTIPYTVKGVIWYQGENNANANAGAQYRLVFSQLIEEWRKDFNDPALPFYFVQLPNLDRKNREHRIAWTEVRDSQQWVADNVENTGMAVLVDGGHRTNIHPPSKDKAGQRLSLLALKNVYGKSVRADAPRLIEGKPDGRAVVLRFNEPVELRAGDGDAFEVCGADKVFFPAVATTRGETIVVSSSNVTEPSFVRYGWDEWFTPVIYGETEIPVGPFRTDDFPLQTEGNYQYMKLDR
ncbi:MAG: sialate O-acetylesterase [Planctomycetota bacterium]